jgi:hypothetical protein
MEDTAQLDLNIEMWIHEEPLCEEDHVPARRTEWPMPACGVVARARLVFTCDKSQRLICTPLARWCEVPPSVTCLKCGTSSCILVSWF